MKVIIIGASGYIGKAMLELALSKFDVYGTSSTGANGKMQFDLGSSSSFDYEFIHESDVVVIAAAISAPDVCSKEHARAWAVNVTGTSLFIAKVIARGAKIIFLSSDTVYGESLDNFDESAACNPAGDYAIMKHEIEKQYFGNPSFKSIRLSYVFSKQDKFSAYLQGCVAREEEAEIFHPFYRAVIHRDDVLNGVLALAEHWDKFPQKVINFGGPNVVSRVEFADALKNIALPRLRFSVVEPDAGFFTNRPRVIQMQSPILELLLGRPARTLSEAIHFEFDL